MYVAVAHVCQNQNFLTKITSTSILLKRMSCFFSLSLSISFSFVKIWVVTVHFTKRMQLDVKKLNKDHNCLIFVDWN